MLVLPFPPLCSHPPLSYSSLSFSPLLFSYLCLFFLLTFLLPFPCLCIDLDTVKVGQLLQQFYTKMIQNPNSFSINMNGMNGTSSFTVTITVDQKATVLIAIGQDVGQEFITEVLKHSRFVRQPRSAQRRACAALSAFDDLHFIQSRQSKTGLGS